MITGQRNTLLWRHAETTALTNLFNCTNQQIKDSVSMNFWREMDTDFCFLLYHPELNSLELMWADVKDYIDLTQHNVHIEGCEGRV